MLVIGTIEKANGQFVICDEFGQNYKFWLHPSEIELSDSDLGHIAYGSKYNNEVEAVKVSVRTADTEDELRSEISYITNRLSQGLQVA